MSDSHIILAKRIARDLGIDDWQEVLAVVRRVHGGIYACHEVLTGDEYETLCDSVEAAMHGQRE
jgi:hypothetical protein